MFCHHCGNALRDDAQFCPNCGTPVYSPQAPRSEATETPAPPREVQENMPLGILGAVMGAVLGGVIMILFDQLEIYSAFVGFVLAICTLRGYEYLGRKRSTAGTVICVVLMLAAVYIANTVTWVLVILESYADFNLDFRESLELFYILLFNGSIDFGMYAQEVLTLLGFTAFGAVATLSGAVGSWRRRA